MIEDKINFIQNEYLPLLQKLTPGQHGKWGKMDAQQMVEHMRDVFKLANGKIVLPLLNTDPEKLAVRRAFIMSDGSFSENTKSAVMPEEPRPHKYSGLPEAIAKLEEELRAMFTVYEENPALTLMHPIFGELNYEQQISYMDKHVRHHLRQFGLVD